MTGETFLRFILSMSIAFPAIAGAMRFRKIGSSYRPFLIYVFVSLLNELIVGFLILPISKEANVMNWNLFNLFEASILLVQFYYWERFGRVKKIFPFLLIVFICGWVLENLMIHNIYHFNYIFLIAYSFTLVMLSVQTINYIIVNVGRQSLTKNAMFIICTGMVIFFIYNIFVFTLLAKGPKNFPKTLMWNIYSIRTYVNAFVNILYGIGVCFIPKKITGKDLFRDLYGK